MDKFDMLINAAGVFFLLSFISVWFGSSFAEVERAKREIEEKFAKA